MYHEVELPYAFLWRLREGLKDDGVVVVVDLNRPTRRHGIPPSLLKCEMAAIGLRPAYFQSEGGDAYFVAFQNCRSAPSARRSSRAR